jgi:hypothetical protein
MKSFEWGQNKLTLDCIYNQRSIISPIIKTKNQCQFRIDCIENTFDVIFGPKEYLDEEGKDVTVDRCYFYVWFNAICKECNNTKVFTGDLVLDFLDRKIENIVLDRELRYLVSGKNKYAITIEYDLPQEQDKSIWVRKFDQNETCFDMDIHYDPLAATLPYFDTQELSDQQLIEKIKLYLILS